MHAYTSYHLFLPISLLIVLQEDLPLDDEIKLRQEYKRLKQAMEMVGFLASTKKQYVLTNSTNGKLLVQVKIASSTLHTV